MFICMTKKEMAQRRKELNFIVRLLDDVGWVYGEGAELHVRRHTRSEWAQMALAGKGVAANGRALPVWMNKQLEALPKEQDAVLCLRLDGGQGFEPEESNELEFRDLVAGKDAFREIVEEFGKRERGTKFPDLVRHYVKERFGGTQEAAAQKAHLNPQTVNQICSWKKDPNIRRERPVVFALAFAFRLNLAEAVEFLNAAGFSFSDCDDDQLFRLCFKRGFYDIDKINDVLLTIQKPPLGSQMRGMK